MKLLAIETSCDETAAAVICDADDPSSRILSNVIYSQIEEHADYGGVVPEIAARAHILKADDVIRCACDEAGCSLHDVNAIAATGGPGLIGGVIVGVMSAKMLAASLKKPLLLVNHLEGHALTVRLTDNTPFPYLLLLVSGGHCQYLLVRGLGDYTILGASIDDALGEAFDKVAKMMGLPYPGGPRIEQLAKHGNAERFSLPRPLIGKQGCNLSFAGLKTAVRYELEKLRDENRQLSEQDIADMAASFQATACAVLTKKTNIAMQLAKEQMPEISQLVIAGGVAANQAISKEMSALCAKHGWSLTVPPPKLCTDNAAMIGWAATERFKAGETTPQDFAPKARWSLESL